MSVRRARIKKLKSQINYLRGLISELILIIRILKGNFTVLEWRYKNPGGEIDIIYLDKNKNLLIFVEVKYRSGFTSCDRFGLVSQSKMRRISQAAEIFLSENYHLYKNYNIRFDFCGIDDTLKIFYIKNAW